MLLDAILWRKAFWSVLTLEKVFAHPEEQNEVEAGKGNATVDKDNTWKQKIKWQSEMSTYFVDVSI